MTAVERGTGCTSDDVGVPDPDDAQLQALVRLAAMIARVPTATVNLLAHGRQRQPFTVGFDGEDTPLDESMCAWAARGHDRPTYVSDASVDPRFADNPWVDGRRAAVRLYASYPLRSRDDVLLGTLCVFDTAPGSLDGAQLAALADLATTATALLEHRIDARARDRLAVESEELRRLEAAQDARLIARQAALVAVQSWVAEAELVPAPVGDRICRGAQDVAAAGGAAVVEARGDRLVVRCATGTLEGALPAELSAAGSLAGRAARWQTVVRAGAGDLDPAGVQEGAVVPDVALLAVPLHHGGTVVGVLLVAGAGPHDLGAEEAESLEVLAVPFGAALTNALAMERAVEEAATDAVTGLPGRSAAVLVLGQALARQDRFGGHLGLLMLRVDGLDGLDDAHGAGARTRVLRHVGARLSATVRRVDTAARYGADRFVVVAEKLTRLPDGELLADRLAHATGDPCELEDGTRLAVAVTVGVALAPDVVTGFVEPMPVRTAMLLAAAADAVDAARSGERVLLPV